MRAIPGIEEVTETTYRRKTPVGWVEVTSHDGASEVLVSGAPQDERIAHMFDLHADTASIAAHIGYPTAWLPGCWAPFELAVRAILGQQVSVAAARTFAGRLVALCGEGYFPSPLAVRNADLMSIGLTRRRADTIRRLAQAPPDYSFAALTSIPGIGPWTAHYIAMRALKDMDAFPASDLVLRKALGLTEKQLLAHAEKWRPYRAYAVIQVWRYAAPRLARISSACQCRMRASYPASSLADT